MNEPLPPLGEVIKQIRQFGDARRQVEPVCNWFTVYFTKEFQTFDRKTTGARISPGDRLMKTALDLLPAGAVHLPPEDRAGCFLPLVGCLCGIADRWPDVADTALSAVFHLDGVKSFYHGIGDGMKPAVQAEIDGMNGHLAALKKDLLELSARLTRAGNAATHGAQPSEQCNDLKPEDSRRDAIKFCARLVCYVWNTGEHRSKKRSTDYVFIKAQKGDSLFGACKRARELLERWAISPGTVQTEAARLHAAQSGTKHKKRDGMERPETMHEAGKKSREKEQAEIRAEERAQGKRKAKQGTRQSGKKR